VHLGVVDPESPDLDDDLTVLGQRLGDLAVNQAVEPAEFRQHDRAHAFAARLFTYDCGRRG
jgi:hypothetical protein